MGGATSADRPQGPQKSPEGASRPIEVGDSGCQEAPSLKSNRAASPVGEGGSETRYRNQEDSSQVQMKLSALSDSKPQRQSEQVMTVEKCRDGRWKLKSRPKLNMYYPCDGKTK